MLLFLADLGARPRIGQWQRAIPPQEEDKTLPADNHLGLASPLKRALSNQGGFKFYGARGKRRNIGAEKFSYMPLRG